MIRRSLLAALACWPAAHALAQDEGTRPRHKISAAELHEALSARFPLRLNFRSLIELQVSAPRLHLLPERNLLGAGLLMELGGPALRRVHVGEVDLAFALRYEPSDQSVRAHQLELLALRAPDLPRDAAQSLQRILPAIAREALGEIVLHRFTPRQLALADTLGFEPEKLTVLEDGVLIEFGPKARR